MHDFHNTAAIFLVQVAIVWQGDSSLNHPAKLLELPLNPRAHYIANRKTFRSSLYSRTCQCMSVATNKNLDTCHHVQSRMNVFYLTWISPRCYYFQHTSPLIEHTRKGLQRETHPSLAVVTGLLNEATKRYSMTLVHYCNEPLSFR